MEFPNQITGSVAVIGDVHGQVDQVQAILDRLRRRKDFQRRWIIFIGDLVDRGPNPKGAIDLVLDLIEEHPQTIVLSGNHELAMSGATRLVETPDESDWSGRWLDHYGSQSTFESYRIPFGQLETLRERMPENHRQLLQALPWAVEHPEFFFVHSGLDPHISFDAQRDVLFGRDFSLNRPDWLCSKRLPFQDPPQDCHKVVVSGHAYVPQVVFSRKRLLIDTTGGTAGSMSCVLLPENQILFANPQIAKEPIWQPEKMMSDLKIKAIPY